MIVERKIALVTGAASGIGFETVKRFLQDPSYATIFAVDKDPKVLGLQTDRIVPLEVDLRSNRHLHDMLERATATGRLDVVVNAAGLIFAGRKKPIYEHYRTEEGRRQYLSLYRTNAIAPLSILIGVEETMKAQGGGTFIAITSSKNHFPDPFRALYEKTKTVVEKDLRYAARSLKKDNIRVVVVKPGNTRTNIDKSLWAVGSNPSEATSVQKFNDWWRERFGNDPRNVAEEIYKIAEGKIRKDVVYVGADAHLGHVLAKTIPGWRYFFLAGSTILYEGVKIAGALMGRSNNKIPSSTYPQEPWYEEMEAELKAKRRTPPVATIQGKDFYRFALSCPSLSVVQLNELGITVEAMETYLESKAKELGDKTELLEDCKPEADGDWRYRYIVKPVPDTKLLAGHILIAYLGQDIFAHELIFSPVEDS